MKSAKRCAVAFCLFSALQAQATMAQESCRRFFFAQPPAWVSSLVEDPATGLLVLVDPKNQQLTLLDPTTAREVLYPASSVPTGSPLRSVTAAGDRLLLKTDSPEASWLDLAGASPTVAGAVNLGGGGGKLRSASPGERSAGQVGSLYLNWAFRKGTVVGFGSINWAPDDLQSATARREFQLGVIRANLDLKQPTQGLEGARFLIRSEENDYYRIGYQFFASTDDGLYFLRMFDTPVLFQVLDQEPWKREVVNVLPRGFDALPLLRTEAKLDVGSLLAKFEKSSSIAGLYGQGHFLFVLTREFDSSQSTAIWKLHKIDPLKGKLQGSIQLPTSAEHVSILVTRTAWYVIERGSTARWGEQTIKSWLKIPSSLISDVASSPLASGRSSSLLCR